MYEAEVQCDKCASVTKHKFLCLMPIEAKQSGISEFGAEKGVLQGQTRRWVACAQQKPKLPKGFQQSILKGQVRGVTLVVANFLAQENPLSTKVRSRCSCKTPTKEMFSVLQFYVYMDETCYTLKGQSLENGLSCLFQASGHKEGPQRVWLRDPSSQTNKLIRLFYEPDKILTCLGQVTDFQAGLSPESAFLTQSEGNRTQRLK